MVDQWYYWHGAEIYGPFSGKHLVGLAVDGQLLPDDIVWKEGVERGVPARTVRHLFPPALPGGATDTIDSVPESPPTAAAAVAETAKSGGESDLAAPAAVTPSASSVPTSALGQGSSYYPPVGKARAVAGKGAVIVGQDGTTVKFRMKCTTCGHEDNSWRAIPITRGTTRSSFYCPKCRKRRDCEVHGYRS